MKIQVLMVVACHDLAQQPLCCANVQQDPVIIQRSAMALTFRYFQIVSFYIQKKKTFLFFHCFLM